MKRSRYANRIVIIFGEGMERKVLTGCTVGPYCISRHLFECPFGSIFGFISWWDTKEPLPMCLSRSSIIHPGHLEVEQFELRETGLV